VWVKQKAVKNVVILRVENQSSATLIKRNNFFIFI